MDCRNYGVDELAAIEWRFNGRAIPHSFCAFAKISAENTMIARFWHGRVPTEKADRYVDYVTTTGLADYQHTKGNRGAYILRRAEGEITHIMTFSFWDSIDAIKGFAGEEYERARYYSEDKEFLLEFEPLVTHYEVVAASNVDTSSL